MLKTRYYKCLSCGESFTSFDGVVCLPPAGVKCPICNSKKTIENPFGEIKSWFGK